MRYILSEKEMRQLLSKEEDRNKNKITKMLIDAYEFHIERLETKIETLEMELKKDGETK